MPRGPPHSSSAQALKRYEEGRRGPNSRIEAGFLRLGLRSEDVFINLVEVPKENWSFGNGEAQYAA